MKDLGNGARARHQLRATPFLCWLFGCSEGANRTLDIDRTRKYPYMLMLTAYIKHTTVILLQGRCRRAPSDTGEALRDAAEQLHEQRQLVFVPAPYTVVVCMTPKPTYRSASSRVCKAAQLQSLTKGIRPRGGHLFVSTLAPCYGSLLIVMGGWPAGDGFASSDWSTCDFHQAKR